MRISHRTFHRSAAILLAISIAGSAHAADPESPSVVSAQAVQPRPDFLFGPPRFSVSVRGAWLAPREGGDLFAFVRQQLTIDRGAFATAAAAADVGVILNSRLAILAGFDAGRASVTSEYRHFIGRDGLPIAQKTRLASAGVAGSLKVNLIEPGRRISRYAWIPRTITPFAGAGGGLTHYNFRQDGEFVDFLDRSIFQERFQSRGWGPSAQVFGGADMRAWRNVSLTVQARYVWSHADLGPDFVDFDGIDLSGLRVESGVRFVF
jgi:hypothetical protein